jgi:hypothetical protein
VCNELSRQSACGVSQEVPIGATLQKCRGRKGQRQSRYAIAKEWDRHARAGASGLQTRIVVRQRRNEPPAALPMRISGRRLDPSRPQPSSFRMAGLLAESAILRAATRDCPTKDMASSLSLAGTAEGKRLPTRTAHRSRLGCEREGDFTTVVRQLLGCYSTTSMMWRSSIGPSSRPGRLAPREDRRR